jgi:hypothetical protein
VEAYTDYPLVTNDNSLKVVEVISYDGDKYCQIKWENKKYEIKRYHLFRYKNLSRNISRKSLQQLPLSEFPAIFLDVEKYNRKRKQWTQTN